jgi:inhibitor of KinA sporulation pathway (predicted exonuclease)
VGKNGYLERQKRTIDVFRQAEKETYIQYMTDTLILTLNDSDVMGKDVFGEQRLNKVLDAWGKKFDQYHGALEDTAEADWYQDKLDRQLKAACRGGFVPFQERYSFIKKQVYSKKR